jgi:hypothetical protein
MTIRPLFLFTWRDSLGPDGCVACAILSRDIRPALLAAPSAVMMIRNDLLNDLLLPFWSHPRLRETPRQMTRSFRGIPIFISK